jgi:uncharacterized protein
MIIDAHLHCTGRETTSDVLHTLDGAQIDQAVLLAPFLGDGYSLDDPRSLVAANVHLARLVRGHADRLIGFAVVDPRDPHSPQALRHAVESLGLQGVKMVPTGWYPYEDRVQPVFAMASELKLPVLFHSGIFIDGRSGRFCRPSFFEVMRDHPGARVALAHCGWPWTDEAIAVALIDRIHGVPEDECAFRLDISFGPPPPYRKEVLSRALEVIGAGLLQFGSDCFLPCSAEHIRERMDWVRTLFDELQLDAETSQRIWSGTAAAWLGPACRMQGNGAPKAEGELPVPMTPVASAAASASVSISAPATAPAPSLAPTSSSAASAPARASSSLRFGRQPGWLRRPGCWSPRCC